MLTNAPALHSLLIRERNDAARILEYHSRIGGYLRKLNLQECSLGEDSTGLLANIVSFYPDLESLSLEGCDSLTNTGCCFIPRLKKLSELNLSHCQVHYVYVKTLKGCVRIHETSTRTQLELHCIYWGKEENYCSFKSCCIISILFYTKWHSFNDFIIIGSSNIFS